MPPSGPRPITPQIVHRQVVLEEHDASADGRFAICVRRFVQANAYRSHLWLVPLGGGRARAITSGAVRDTRPRISPDGSRVCFKRAPVQRESGSEDEGTRLMVLSLRDGAEWSVATGRGAVGEAEWAPDGSRLAFTREAGEPRFIVGRAAKGKSPTARHITRLDYRFDGEGYLDRWSHLFLVAARPRARPRQLTRGEFSVSGITWRPDGEALAYAADPRPDADVRPRSSIWVVDVDGGGQPREAISLGREAKAPAWSPDGRWLACVGIVDANALDDASPELVIASADGGEPIRLAPDLDRPIGAWLDTDLNGWMASSTDGPLWAEAGTIVALVSDRGRSVPWRFPVRDNGAAAAKPAPLSQEDAACWTLAVSPQAPGGPLVSAIGTLDSRPMELMTAPLAGGRLRTRTSQGSRWRNGLRWPRMESVQAPGQGGPIETWICSPQDAGDRALPTVVHIHGGPLGAWAPAPSIDDLILASAGYRVISPNIRGSAGYGGPWIRPQLGDWGGVDASDVHAAIDHVVGLGLSDPERLGVLGLSYGGFMVHWLIATSGRFRAAVADNGVANQVSAWANSDTGVEYSRTSELGDVLTADGVAKLWRQSPLARVADVRTPLLMFQAEADRRCPPADNEQFFTALRVLGREVEYVLYPDESHIYSVTGRPDRREDRMRRMLEWFERYLGSGS